MVYKVKNYAIFSGFPNNNRVVKEDKIFKKKTRVLDKVCDRLGWEKSTYIFKIVDIVNVGLS